MNNLLRSKFSKFFALVLSVIMVVTLIPSTFVYADEDEDDFEPSSYFDDPTAVVQDMASILEAFDNILDGYYLTGAGSGIVTILTALGILEDDDARFKAQVQQGLRDIQNNLDEVKVDINDVKKSIDDLKQNDILRDKYTAIKNGQSAYDKFMQNCSSKLTEKINALGVASHQIMIDWYKSDEPVEDIELVLPDTSYSANHQFNYTIPGEMISEARKEYRESQTKKFNRDIANNIKIAICDIFKNVENKLENSGDNNLKEIYYWMNRNYRSDPTQGMTPEEHNQAIDYFVNECYMAINNIAFEKVCKEDYGKTYSFAEQTVEAFETYCKAMLTESTSPIQGLYDVYENRFLFQGDLKHTAKRSVRNETTGEIQEENIETNRAQDVKNYFLYEVSDFATFVTAVAKKADFDNSKIEKRIKKNWQNVMEYLKNKYAGFHKVENGEDADNYCYYFGGILEAKECKVSSSIETKFDYSWNRTDSYVERFVLKSIKPTDWHTNIDLRNNSIINSVDLGAMYKIYEKYEKALFNDKTFRMHLINNVELKAPSFYINILTKFGVGNYGLNENKGMYVEQVTTDGSNYFTNYQKNGWKVNVYDGSLNKVEKENFELYNRANVELFNTYNATTWTEQLLKAFYHEDHWYWDVAEAAFLWHLGVDDRNFGKSFGYSNFDTSTAGFHEDAEKYFDVSKPYTVIQVKPLANNNLLKEPQEPEEEPCYYPDGSGYCVAEHGDSIIEELNSYGKGTYEEKYGKVPYQLSYECDDANGKTETEAETMFENAIKSNTENLDKVSEAYKFYGEQIATKLKPQNIKINSTQLKKLKPLEEAQVLNKLVGDKDCEGLDDINNVKLSMVPSLKLVIAQDIDNLTGKWDCKIYPGINTEYVLSWDNEDMKDEVSIETLKQAGINPTIKIPLLDNMGTAKYALVNLYDEFDVLNQTQMEKGFAIKGTNNNRYVEIPSADAECYVCTKLNSVSVPQTTVKLKAGKKALTVSWAKKAVNGYQVQYALKKNFKGAKTVNIKKGTTIKTTIKKLKSKKKYFVRVRCYTNKYGLNFYSAWSKTKYAKVK